jgi:hypothetical protein
MACASGVLVVEGEVEELGGANMLQNSVQLLIATASFCLASAFGVRRLQRQRCLFRPLRWGEVPKLLPQCTLQVLNSWALSPSLIVLNSSQVASVTSAGKPSPQCVPSLRLIHTFYRITHAPRQAPMQGWCE